jgi:hypothetical protein
MTGIIGNLNFERIQLSSQESNDQFGYPVYVFGRISRDNSEIVTKVWWWTAISHSGRMRLFTHTLDATLKTVWCFSLTFLYVALFALDGSIKCWKKGFMVFKRRGIHSISKKWSDRLTGHGRTVLTAVGETNSFGTSDTSKSYTKQYQNIKRCSWESHRKSIHE